MKPIDIMPQSKKKTFTINKETERFYLTNLIAFEIFLLVSIFTLAQVYGNPVFKIFLPLGIIVGTIGIGGILVMYAIKSDNCLITIFFWTIVLGIILTTLQILITLIQLSKML